MITMVTVRTGQGSVQDDTSGGQALAKYTYTYKGPHVGIGYAYLPTPAVIGIWISDQISLHFLGIIIINWGEPERAPHR